MLGIVSELERFIHEHLEKLHGIAPDVMNHKPSPSRWSKQEIMGHLADSAQNNIRRFIIAQYEKEPHIVYDQDKWVALVNYQQYDQASLINLWYLLNMHIVVILKNIPADRAGRKCRTENLQSIEWLAKDYIRHLKHHVHQVLDLEPVAYP